MPLTKEDRIELLKKAREAKANKRMIKEEEEDEPVINVKVEEPEVKKTRKKKEVVPLPVTPIVIEEDDVEEEPVPVSKKKVLPAKWLKQIKTKPETVCCDEKVTKEEFLIDDKPQVVADKIIIPSKTALKKPRAPRASTPAKTLDLTDKPRDITEVIDELTEGNSKYIPAKVVKAPVTIVHQKLRLFDY